MLLMLISHPHGVSPLFLFHRRRDPVRTPAQADSALRRCRPATEAALVWFPVHRAISKNPKSPDSRLSGFERGPTERGLEEVSGKEGMGAKTLAVGSHRVCMGAN